MIDGFARDGHADLVAQFTRTFPLRVIAHIIGVPIEDYETFKRWSLDVIGFADDPPRGFEAAGKLVDYLRPIVESRRAERARRPDEHAGARRGRRRSASATRRSSASCGCCCRRDRTRRIASSAARCSALLTHPEQLDEVRADRSMIAGGDRRDAALGSAGAVRGARNDGADDARRRRAAGRGAAADGAGLGESRRAPLRSIPTASTSTAASTSTWPSASAATSASGSHLARLEATTALNAIFDRLPNLRLDPIAGVGHRRAWRSGRRTGCRCGSTRERVTLRRALTPALSQGEREQNVGRGMERRRCPSIRRCCTRRRTAWRG